MVLIRRIRELLYGEGFTIHGAKNRLEELDSQWQIRTELEAVLKILGGHELIQADLNQSKKAE